VTTALERRWQQVHDRGTAALAAALLDDADVHPTTEDHVAALDQEQRDLLRDAVEELVQILDNMKGAS
jgi:hypothetical protein